MAKNLEPTDHKKLYNFETDSCSISDIWPTARLDKKKLQLDIRYFGL